MKTTTTLNNDTREQRENKLNDKREAIMPNPSKTSSTKNTEPVHRNTDELKSTKPDLLLRSFKGFNGKGDVFEVCTDPDTGIHHIVDPNMKGGPKGVSSYKVISLFKNQFGNTQIILFPEDTLDQKSVTGETGAELLDRATREWVTLPKKGDGPVSGKFALPEPTPFDFSYSTFLDIMFGDKLIDSLDHPLMKKLMAREANSTKD